MTDARKLRIGSTQRLILRQCLLSDPIGYCLTTYVRPAAKLVERGLAEWTSDRPNDACEMFLRITPEGRAALARVE